MAKTQEQVIKIQKPDEKYLVFTIIGDEPLNVHRLGKKLAEEFNLRDANKTIPKKGARDKQAEFLDSLYYIDKDGKEVDTPKKILKTTRFGFPASGVKKAMVSAGRNFKGIKMTELKGRFFVMGRFIEIEGKPEREEFWRRIGGKGPGTGTPDIGVRAVFPKWQAKVHIRYLANMISGDSVGNLLAAAGISVGLGENRPEKSGDTFGTWHIK